MLVETGATTHSDRIGSLVEQMKNQPVQVLFGEDGVVVGVCRPGRLGNYVTIEEYTPDGTDRMTSLSREVVEDIRLLTPEDQV